LTQVRFLTPIPIFQGETGNQRMPFSEVSRTTGWARTIKAHLTKEEAARHLDTIEQQLATA
jgi:hypothetical protein